MLQHAEGVGEGADPFGRAVGRDETAATKPEKATAFASPYRVGKKGMQSFGELGGLPEIGTVFLIRDGQRVLVG